MHRHQEYEEAITLGSEGLQFGTMLDTETAESSLSWVSPEFICIKKNTAKPFHSTPKALRINTISETGKVEPTLSEALLTYNATRTVLIMRCASMNKPP